MQTVKSCLRNYLLGLLLGLVASLAVVAVTHVEPDRAPQTRRPRYQLDRRMTAPLMLCAHGSNKRAPTYEPSTLAQLDAIIAEERADDALQALMDPQNGSLEARQAQAWAAVGHPRQEAWDPQTSTSIDLNRDYSQDPEDQ